MMKSVIQAYSNTPWRKQLNILGGFFLVLIVLVVLLISYLIVSSTVVSVGRDLQNAKNKIDELEYVNVSLEEKIASLSTLSKIAHQATEQGFHTARLGEVFFVIVPGFEDSFHASAHPNEEPQVPVIEVNVPEYHQTLVDWLQQEMIVFSDAFEGFEP